MLPSVAGHVYPNVQEDLNISSVKEIHLTVNTMAPVTLNATTYQCCEALTCVYEAHVHRKHLVVFCPDAVLECGLQLHKSFACQVAPAGHAFVNPCPGGCWQYRPQVSAWNTGLGSVLQLLICRTINSALRRGATLCVRQAMCFGGTCCLCLQDCDKVTRPKFAHVVTQYPPPPSIYLLLHL